MKIICKKENLIRGLSIVSRAIPVRTTLEIMKCVLIQADGGEMKLTANDTSLGIETRIDATVLEPGSVAIDSALLTSIVRKLPDSDVTIDSDPYNAVSIICEQARFDISGRGTGDFVYLPNVDTDVSVSLSQFTLRNMTNQVIFSISDSDLNAAMSGVHVEIFDDRVRFTTLDGHRISVRVNELKESYDKISVIVPGKTLNDISKILSGDLESTVVLSFARNHIIFEFDRTKVVSRLIEGEYYNIESMLREGYETCVRINKREFLDCLDRSTLLINESDKKPVIIDITDEGMNLRLRSVIGSMNESIPIEKEGKDIKIAFNPKLLMDALRVIDDEEVDIYFLKYNYPCTIKDKEGTYNYVVLPVNFTEE